MAGILLSICIPTYNRSGVLINLINGVLLNKGSFEICVHVDGSTDDTAELLGAISDNRLCWSIGENRGRAGALSEAVKNASGKYCMLFDDDDVLTPEGLQRVLHDCGEPLQEGCVGRIYQLSDASGKLVGSKFPVNRSNFIALRADHGVKGDKKEVVLTKELRRVMAIGSSCRRVPTSLYWACLAKDFDVMCEDFSIGQKNYLSGGMTDSIKRLKRENIDPLIILHRVVIRLFVLKRFRSWRYVSRSLVALLWYRYRLWRGV